MAACLLTTVSVRGQTSHKDRDYEAYIAALAESKDASRVSKAIAALKSAGTEAFPTLLAHLNDETKASFAFQRAEQDIDGHLQLPTIGDVCFDLLQDQIEGNWPKAVRQYYVLSPTNIVSWWHSRKEKSLKGLRIEAAEASLNHARQRRGRSDYSREAIRFLERHLRNIQAAKE